VSIMATGYLMNLVAAATVPFFFISSVTAILC